MTGHQQGGRIRPIKEVFFNVLCADGKRRHVVLWGDEPQQGENYTAWLKDVTLLAQGGAANE
jgi:hypothetical protein